MKTNGIIKSIEVCRIFSDEKDILPSTTPAWERKQRGSSLRAPPGNWEGGDIGCVRIIVPVRE